ncbi:MAG: hypothetical protein K2G69_00065 [Muribaculaceae bacterium]|nr:hypothetical protein [Muribaculaceae bacterium]
MKTIQRIISLLPLCAIAAGCTNSEPEAGMKAKEGDFHVMMSVLPSSSQTAGSGISSSVGEDAERAFDENRLYFATYKLPVSGTTYNGEYMTFLKDGATLNNSGENSVDADYFVPNWGPSVTARLPMADYKNGFAVAVFSVPANTAAAGFTVKDKNLGEEGNFTLKWPGKAADNYVWTPSEEKVGNDYNHIPMAGIVEVSADYMKGYNPNVYTGLSPFGLPDIRPLRAMAKVIIEDPEGLISKLEMKTPTTGMLIPNPVEWIRSGHVNPRMTSSRSFVTQTLTAPNGQNEEGTDCYVLYSYEQSFRTPVFTEDQGAGADGRKIITLYSDKLGKNGTPATTTVSIAPYTTDGKIDTSTEVAALMSKDGGAWQGLMRNRIYTYTISSPSQVGFKITVKVKDWIKNVQDEIL